MATPNILIILADDIGVDSFRVDKATRQVVAQVQGQTSSAGPVRLPNFERMLASGVHFESAWAHPVCTPTRASLWTGMQAWKTGLGFPSATGNDALPDRAFTNAKEPIVSLAQAIKATKPQYRCAMFGKWDLGGVKTPVHVGWDYFAGIFAGGLRPVVVQEYGFPPPPSRLNYERLQAAIGSKKPALCASVAAFLASKYDKTFLANNPDLRYYIWHKDVVEGNGTVSAKQPPTARQELYATADQVADAKQWIAAQAGSPWCVALNLIVPHEPYHLPPTGTYRADTVTDPENPTVQQMFVAMLESMDYYVGDLLKAIDSQLGNTVIIFVGDNGTQDIDTDTGTSVDNVEGDDKAHIAIGGVHVPMIIADGGLMTGGAPCYTKTAPRSVPEPVHIIDVYRTALDIAGATSAAASDSISIAPHLIGHGAKRAHNFSQMYVEPQLDPDGITARTPGTSAAASEGKHKLNCITLTAGPPQNTYLVDENGAKTKMPVYSYEFVRLDPEPGIVGSLIETPIPALERYGSAFAVTDPAYCATILELYGALSRERLDSNQRRFPYIGDAAPLVAIDEISLAHGQHKTIPGIDLHAIDFTIAAKIKLTSTDHRNIVFGNWGSAGNSWQMIFTVLAGGAPYMALRKDMVTNGSNPEQDLLLLQASTSLTAGAWRHVAWTFTWGADRVSPCGTIYVDGVEAGRALPKIPSGAGVRNPYTLMPTHNPYFIGHKEDTNDTDSWFHGEMENFRVYGIALDAARIQQLASA